MQYNLSNEFLDELARPTRFERATPAFGGRYSIQLSYGRLMEILLLILRGDRITAFGVSVQSAIGKTEMMINHVIACLLRTMVFG